jgi:hypothetical protein
LSGKDSSAYFFLFHTIHDVLKAEKALKGRGYAFELVPVPRTLSSDCGVCIRSEGLAGDSIFFLFSLNVDRCFSFDGKEYIPVHPDSLAPSHDKESEDGRAE